MKKDYKPVYIKGTKTGEGIIKALTALGGINNCHYRGTDCDSIYFIMPNNYICATSITSAYGKYVMATAEEVKPARWRAEEGSSYYIVNSVLEVDRFYDDREPSDDKLYNCGNYFRTETEAKEMAKNIKKVLLPD